MKSSKNRAGAADKRSGLDSADAGIEEDSQGWLAGEDRTFRDVLDDDPLARSFGASTGGGMSFGHTGKESRKGASKPRWTAITSLFEEGSKI